jgi:geranylgeranyl transferase type-2 subunit beta
MPDDNYLLRLTARLTEGLGQLPAEVRTRHIEYLQGAQNPDGGFSGREGGSDLYYTAFGLRGLAVLGGLSLEVCSCAEGYLRGCLAQQASVIDFFSFLYACALVQMASGRNVLDNSREDWPDRVAELLETYRTADGGYGKTENAASGSTYHTFLVALCYQLLARSVPRPEEVARFVQSRAREDGGYVEIAPMRRSGTNPTAAAVGTLEILDERGDILTGEMRQRVVDFLAEMASPEGGMRANGRAPLADLLSTFTGTWTLEQLDAGERIDAEEVARFARNSERAEGGFHGGLWDEGHDVEYTFYGLGVLALFPDFY